MILSIGEILADMIGEEQNGVTAFKMYGGGAPFNVAVNAKNAGAKAGFIGRVGRDLVGKFLKGFAAGAGLDFCGIQEDETRNTTLAFVTLKGGERDFAFFRHDTADFHLDSASVALEQWPEVNIVHVGSLMLNEPTGRKFASETVEKIRRAGKLFSFDVNFRADLYGRMHEEYEELWFRGNRNKPWIIGSKTGDSVTDSYFYFKLPQWPNAAIQSSKFPWIDWNYPQDVYKDAQLGNVMSVSVSQHVGLMGKSNGTYADFSDSGLFAPENRAELTGKGFSFSEEYIEKVYNANWGRGYDHATKQNSRARALEGTNFEQQWKTVLDREKDGEASNDIGLVFVTGWNEWIAQKQANSRILGDKYCHFVDTFNMEFSRDIEMNAEYLDNYYLSLVRNIRAYKGVASAAAYSESEDCSGLMNNLDGWNSASAAVYRDFSGETIARNAVDTSGQSELVNVTGRNDIREIRVMSDAEKIYMLVRTEENITPHAAGDTHWMNVFLGIGGQTGGWQGLQYVLNKNPGKEKTSLHRMTNNSFDKIGECNYTVKGNVLRIEIDKKLLGISVADYTLKFKISDNLQKDFDVADLYVSGDTAPLGRMSYVYRAAAK